jgi:GT2 family glycosyltransferase
MEDKVIAIVPTFNRKEPLRQVLKCLGTQVLLQGYKLETVVIVDGSTDGTLEMLREEFSDVHVVLGNGNWWYTKCINSGINKALQLEASYIITLNDDVWFDQNYLLNFLNVAESIGESVIGSASFTQKMPARITFSGIKSIVGWRLKEISYLPKLSVVEISDLQGFRPSCNLSGRGMFFYASILKRIGIFDEGFVQYGSDTDFSFRCFKANIPVMVTFDSKIFENELMTSQGATYNNPTFNVFFKSLFNKYSINSISKSVRYFKKHGNPLLLPIYILLFPASVLYVFLFKYRNVH